MNQESETVDLMKVIIRQKLLIISVVIISVIFAFIFSFFSKRIYQIDSIIGIGSFSGIDGSFSLVESPDELIEKVNKGPYHSLDNKRCGVKAQKIDGTNFVQILAVTSDVDVCTLVIDEITKSVLSDHQKGLKLRVSTLSNIISSTEREIDVLRNKASYNIYFDNTIAQLLIELAKRKEQLSSFTETVVVKKTSPSSLPVNFNIYLSILFALFIGFFVGLFASLCREWWAHHSTELEV